MSTKKKRDYLPCGDSQLEFTRALSIDLMKLNACGIAIIKDLREDCNNLTKYKYEFQPVDRDFKVPLEFERCNCFHLRVEDYSFFIYKDILSEDNICIMFDLVHHLT